MTAHWRRATEMALGKDATKATVDDKAGTVSMAVLQEVAEAAAKALFGLP